jgi:hypothetical protein
MTFNELLNSDILKDVVDNPNSLIHIDIDDIKDLSQQENEIYAFNIKVDCFEEQRMEHGMYIHERENCSNSRCITSQYLLLHVAILVWR